MAGSRVSRCRVLFDFLMTFLLSYLFVGFFSADVPAFF